MAPLMTARRRLSSQHGGAPSERQAQQEALRLRAALRSYELRYPRAFHE